MFLFVRCSLPYTHRDRITDHERIICCVLFFFSPLCPSLKDLPAIQLCLEQKDQTEILGTPNPKNLSCVPPGNSPWSKAHLPGNGPQEDFASFVEWVQVNNGSVLTISPAEDITRAQPAITPLHGHDCRAHHRRRARACLDARASSFKEH